MQQKIVAKADVSDKPQAVPGCLCQEELAPAVRPHSSLDKQGAPAIAKVKKGVRQKSVMRPDWRSTASASDACIHPYGEDFVRVHGDVVCE